eukprot:jgi/Mesvir1/20484/Mv12371-RA.1
MPGFYKQMPTISADAVHSYHSSASRVLQMIDQVRSQLRKGQFFFGREVSSYSENDDGTVQVTWRDARSGANFNDTFAGIHLRTGRLGKPRSRSYPGEQDFAGQICTGCLRDDLQGENVAGRDVVVVGYGAFAVEAASCCLTLGARSVTLLAQRHRFHLFDVPTWAMGSFYSPRAAHGSKHNWDIWDRTLALNRKAARALGVEDLVFNEQTTTMLQGREHVIFRDGLPAFSFDALALGVHYGLVRILTGDVDHLSWCAVVTSSNDVIPCDVFIHATGFDPDPPESFQNKVVCDSLWLQGKANQTSIHGRCAAPPCCVMGPSVPGASLLLVSYIVLWDLDRVVAYFIRNPGRFLEFAALPAFSTVREFKDVTYPSILIAFHKMLASGNPDITRLFRDSMAHKGGGLCDLFVEERARGERALEFLRADRAKWDALCRMFSERTGKPAPEYPFEEELRGGASAGVPESLV